MEANKGHVGVIGWTKTGYVAFNADGVLLFFTPSEADIHAAYLTEAAKRARAACGEKQIVVDVSEYVMSN